MFKKYAKWLKAENNPLVASRKKRKKYK